MTWLLLVTFALAFIGLTQLLSSRWEESVILSDIVHQRLVRDAELREAMDAFLAEYGREPTARELWSISPPEMEDLM